MSEPQIVAALPFWSEGELQELDGTVIEAVVALSLWPVGQRVDAAGRHFDYVGQADLAHYAALSAPNVQLNVDGTIYKVVEAIAYRDAIPHVALELRETRNA